MKKPVANWDYNRTGSLTRLWRDAAGVQYTIPLKRVRGLRFRCCDFGPKGVRLQPFAVEGETDDAAAAAADEHLEAMQSAAFRPPTAREQTAEYRRRAKERLRRRDAERTAAARHRHS